MFHIFIIHLTIWFSRLQGKKKILCSKEKSIRYNFLTHGSLMRTYTENLKKEFTSLWYYEQNPIVEA